MTGPTNEASFTSDKGIRDLPFSRLEKGTSAPVTDYAGAVKKSKKDNIEVDHGEVS
jgi:hypothetical protein